MTTYTLSGTQVDKHSTGAVALSVQTNSPALTLVFPESTATLNYIYPDSGGKTQLNFDTYSIQLNGQELGTEITDYSLFFLDVEWLDDAGQRFSTTILDVLVDDHDLGSGFRDTEFFFVLAGDELPFSTVSGYWDWLNRLDDVSPAGAPYASGQLISVSALSPTSVTENDTITGTGEADQLDGGKGDDTISGGAGDDVLSGGGGRDILRGEAGNDTLHGGKKNDLLVGGDGDDLLVGGHGLDRLVGGNGTDTAGYAGATSGVIADLNDPRNNTGDARGDKYSSIENLSGTQFRDSLTGNAANNLLLGLGGNDRLNGQHGRDKLDGGAGRDLLKGGAGNDILNGGDGRDQLIGGKGNDVLTGGGGADVFVFSAGADRITDFRNDRLKLDDALWNNATLTNAQILDFASVVNGDTVFDFGNGDTLTLEDFTRPARLEDLVDLI